MQDRVELIKKVQSDKRIFCCVINRRAGMGQRSC